MRLNTVERAQKTDDFSPLRADVSVTRCDDNQVDGAARAAGSGEEYGRGRVQINRLGAGLAVGQLDQRPLEIDPSPFEPEHLAFATAGQRPAVTPGLFAIALGTTPR